MQKDPVISNSPVTCYAYDIACDQVEPLARRTPELFLFSVKALKSSFAEIPVLVSVSFVSKKIITTVVTD